MASNFRESRGNVGNENAAVRRFCSAAAASESGISPQRDFALGPGGGTIRKFPLKQGQIVRMQTNGNAVVQTHAVDGPRNEFLRIESTLFDGLKSEMRRGSDGQFDRHVLQLRQRLLSALFQLINRDVQRFQQTDHLFREC